MSEYQYYEFQALDQSLDASQQAELRKYSTRAHITSRSFINEYQWGNFKGSVTQWMTKYFDAHLYLSNFGHRQLHLRLPRGFVDLKNARYYEAEGALEIRETPTHVIFSFFGNNDGGDDYDEFDENPSGVMASFLPLREALAQGDMRPLYIAWLAGAQNGHVSKEAAAPVPPGLGGDGSILHDLADFLWLSPALLQVAARRSGGTKHQQPTTGQMKQWIRKLSADEKDAWLLRFLEEPLNTAGINFRRAFFKSQPKAAVTSSSQTVEQLLDEAETLERQQQEAADIKAAAKKAEEDRKAKEARQFRLKPLQGKEPDLWQSVTTLTATSTPANYNAAVKQLIDLRDLAEMSGEINLFQEKLNALCELRHRKPSLLERIKKAGM